MLFRTERTMNGCRGCSRDLPFVNGSGPYELKRRFKACNAGYSEF